MQTIKLNKQSKLVELIRLQNSRNGNPKFRLVFENGLIGNTRTDSGEAYKLCDSWIGRSVKFDWSVNNRGQTFISDFDLVD